MAEIRHRCVRKMRGFFKTILMLLKNNSIFWGLFALKRTKNARKPSGLHVSRNRANVEQPKKESVSFFSQVFNPLILKCNFRYSEKKLFFFDYYIFI